MKVELPELPYAIDSLEPHISARTLEWHHGRHHKGYVDKTLDAIKGTDLEGASLEQVILAASTDNDNLKLYNNAAQIYNHSVYFRSLSPQGGDRPEGNLAHKITADFGSFESFSEEFKQAGLSHFGSGYIWLSYREGSLHIESTSDAEMPLGAFNSALLNVDVWEHAYYLDRQADRTAYLEAIMTHLLNWDYANENFLRCNE